MYGGEHPTLERVRVGRGARVPTKRSIAIVALVALVAAPVQPGFDDALAAGAVRTLDRDGAGERDHASRLPPKRRGSHYRAPNGFWLE